MSTTELHERPLRTLHVSSTSAFEHLETHELIEAEDLNPILEQAKGITAQLPDT